MATLALMLGMRSMSVSAEIPQPHSVDTVLEVVTAAQEGKTPDHQELLAILADGAPGSTMRLVERMDVRGSRRLAVGPKRSLEASLAGLVDYVRTRRNEQTAENWSNEARVAIEYLTLRSSSADYEDAFVIATPHDSATHRMAQDTSDTLMRMIMATIIRDRSSFARLERLWPGAHPAVRRSLLTALGNSLDVEAAPLLTRLLGGEVSSDVLILIQLAKAGRHRLAPLDDSSYERIRVYLRRDEPKLRASAAQALGRLDDQESVDRLIGMLEDKNASVRVGVHFALKLLTAMTLDSSTRPWRSWYESERRWYNEERPGLFEKLRTIEPKQMAPMLRELAAHQLYRRELGELLVPFLTDPDPEIVRMVIAAMQGLRADTAVDALARCRDQHTEDSVVEQATHAIWVITGEPPERQILGSSG
jgi:hypothetical protein